MHYFRYKDGWELEKNAVEISPVETTVYTSRQQLPDGFLIVDFEYAKLEMECGSLKKTNV